MQHDHLEPATIEDAEADLAVRRARNAGAGWILAAGAAFWVSAVAGGGPVGIAAFTLCVALLGLSLRSRTRSLREAKRRYGDATVQRARWRVAAEGDQSSRLWWALALVALMLASQAWRR